MKVDVLGVYFGKVCGKRISLNFQRVDLGVIHKTFFENLLVHGSLHRVVVEFFSP